jgi:hypothetical protein
MAALWVLDPFENLNLANESPRSKQITLGERHRPMSNYGLAKLPAAGAALAAWTAVAMADAPPRDIHGTIASVQAHTVAVTTGRDATWPRKRRTAELVLVYAAI